MKNHLLNPACSTGNVLRGISLLCILLANIQTVKGNNYYFSTSLGDDSRTAAQAQNPATPWKTLAKLNSYFINLNPGDSLLFKRGEVFNGSIIINKSGTSVARIVISAYGAGNKPIITGLATLTNWALVQGGIYESYNGSLGSQVNTVLINNAPQEMGRWPNSNTTNKGYRIISSFSSKISITDNQLTNSPNWTGAQLVIRKNRWAIDRCPITLHSGTTINYTSTSTYSATTGFGYFIQNDIKTLDSFGEWYYNPSTKKLDVYFGGNNASSYTVQASTVDKVFTATNISYVTLDNLSIRGANTYGIKLSGGTGFTIQNCDILYSGYNGIDASSTTNLKVDKCLVDYSNNRGIYASLDNITPLLINNTVKNTGVFAGMGEKNGNLNGYIGIEISSDNAVIKGNNVINSGCHGITFGHNSSTVQNNFIDNFCFVKDDGGGIYMHEGSSNTNYTNRKIIGNIIMNGKGAPEGTNSITPNVRGIYLDDNTNNVEVTGNTVANVNGSGLFLHNARYITAKYNILYNNGIPGSSNSGQFATQHDNLGDAVRNCIIKNNIFFSKSSTQIVSYILNTISDDVVSMGQFDSNYYCRPINENNIIKVLAPSYTYYSLDGWKKKYGKDVNSKKTITTISDTGKIRFEYNETSLTKTLSLPKTYTGIDGTQYSGSMNLAPYTSVVLIDATAGSLTGTSAANNLSKDPFVRKKLTVKAQPNPSTYYFNIVTESANNQPLTVKVIDLAGRVLETKNRINANSALQLGHNLKSGIYIIEVIQGTERVQQKVVKLPN